MTQHLLPEHAEEDQRIMRRLAIIVAGFIVFTASLAIGVGIVMG